MVKRSGDNNEKTFFRSERYYCIGGQWFFTCREGKEFGPFESHTEAKTELMLFLRNIGQWILDTNSDHGKAQLEAFGQK